MSCQLTVAPFAGPWPQLGLVGRAEPALCWVGRVEASDVVAALAGVVDLAQRMDARTRPADPRAAVLEAWTQLEGDGLVVGLVPGGVALAGRGITGLWTAAAGGWVPLVPEDHPLRVGARGLFVVPRLPPRLCVGFGGASPGGWSAVDLEVAWNPS